MAVLSKSVPLKVASPKVTSPKTVYSHPPQTAAEGQSIAPYIIAGVAIAALIGIYAFRKIEQGKPMTQLQQLKAQLGLSDEDFKDLKSTLGKLNIDQLRELKRAAW